MNDFLNSLSDRELAFLVHHKLDSYLKNTQEKILAHLKERNLSSGDLENLRRSEAAITDEFHERCPRCASEKHTKTENIAHQPHRRVPFMHADEKPILAVFKQCIVCDYVLNDDNGEVSKSKFFAIRFSWLKLFWNKFFYGNSKT